MKVRVQWVLFAVILTWLLAIGIVAVFGEGGQEQRAPEFLGPQAIVRQIGKTWGSLIYEMSYGGKTYIVVTSRSDGGGVVIIEK